MIDTKNAIIAATETVNRMKRLNTDAKRVALFLGRDDSHSIATAQKLKRLLIKNKLYVESDANFVIFVGGDGTLLRAVQENLNNLSNIAFIGVVTGTLGFFADYTGNELELLVRNILTDDFVYQENTLLEGKLTNSFGEKRVYALNEIRIENPFHTLVVNVNIDNSFLEEYHGSGLSICSSLGSTAYNRSLGGAIMSSSVNLLQLTEISTITNNRFSSLNSPLVLGDKQVVSISGVFSNCVIGHDHLSFSLPNENNKSLFTISLSDKKVLFAQRKHLSATDRLRRAFIN